MAAVVAVVLAAGPAFAGTGWLDPSFGSSGVARVPPPCCGATLADRLLLRVGPTGRLFLFEELSSGDTSDSGFLRVRGSTGGVLSTFNGGAAILMGSSGDLAVRPLGLAPLADGGVVTGRAVYDVAYPASIAIVQRAADGHVVAAAMSLPGRGGGASDIYSQMVRLPGGSIRLCGTDEGTGEVRLLGLTPALQPDARLGAGDYRVLDAPLCHAIGSDPAGRIYIAGRGMVGDRAVIEVRRLTSSGALDTGWGTNGLTIVELAGQNLGFAYDARTRPMIVASPDGSVLIPAQTSPTAPTGPTQAAVVRLTPSGAPDPSFDGDGIALLVPPGGRARLFAMDADMTGRPVVSVVYNPASGGVRAYLARLTTSGALDVTFGQAGLIPTTRAARSIDIDSANRILTAAPDGADVLIARRTS